MDINQLLVDVEKNHTATPADDQAVDRLEHFESTSGFTVPNDMRSFYQRFNRERFPHGHQFLPISDWLRSGAALCGDELGGFRTGVVVRILRLLRWRLGGDRLGAAGAVKDERDLHR